MTKKQAFTLTETLIMIAVIGIIATISVASLKNTRPDKDAFMVRKVYAEISKTVATLASDRELYPVTTAFLYSPAALLVPIMQASLADVEVDYSMPTIYDETEAEESDAAEDFQTSFGDYNLLDNNADDFTKGTASLGTSNLRDNSLTDASSKTVIQTPSGSPFLNTSVMNSATAYTTSNKFAYNFGKLFKNDNLSCSGRVCTFSTVDGMNWTVTDNFSASTKNAIISVDINGSSQGANSSTSATPDVYNFQVSSNGGVSVYGSDNAATNAKKYLKKRK